MSADYAVSKAATSLLLCGERGDNFPPVLLSWGWFQGKRLEVDHLYFPATLGTLDKLALYRIFDERDIGCALGTGHILLHDSLLLI
jgi:hypothetical protein